MKQDLDVVTKAIREGKISSRRQQEEAERNMLGVLYTLALELSGNDSVAEMEAETKLDEALEGKKAANEISDLAADWYSSGKEAGFRMGFHMATKLLVEGLNVGTM